jgi:hypothetical protein
VCFLKTGNKKTPKALSSEFYLPFLYRTFFFFYRQERQARQDLMVFLALLAPWRFFLPFVR